jgi:hypothetical protein
LNNDKYDEVKRELPQPRMEVEAPRGGGGGSSLIIRRKLLILRHGSFLRAETLQGTSKVNKELHIKLEAS